MRKMWLITVAAGLVLGGCWSTFDQPYEDKYGPHPGDDDDAADDDDVADDDDMTDDDDSQTDDG